MSLPVWGRGLRGGPPLWNILPILRGLDAHFTKKLVQQMYARKFRNGMYCTGHPELWCAVALRSQRLKDMWWTKGDDFTVLEYNYKGVLYLVRPTVCKVCIYVWKHHNTMHLGKTPIVMFLCLFMWTRFLRAQLKEQNIFHLHTDLLRVQLWFVSCVEFQLQL